MFQFREGSETFFVSVSATMLRVRANVETFREIMFPQQRLLVCGALSKHSWSETLVNRSPGGGGGGGSTVWRGFARMGYLFQVGGIQNLVKSLCRYTKAVPFSVESI